MKKNASVFLLKIEKSKNFYCMDKTGALVPLTEKALAQEHRDFRYLNEAGRERVQRQFLAGREVVSLGKVPLYLATAISDAGPAELRAGAQALLELGQLFPKPLTGWELLADLLAAPWVRDLQQLEPGFRSVTVVTDTGPAVEAIFTTLVRAANTCTKWRKGRMRIHRKPVLDYRGGSPLVSKRIQDFAHIRIHGYNFGKFRFPCSYTGASALVVGASSQQLREAEPCLMNATVFLVDCACCDRQGRKLPRRTLDAYDPAVLEHLTQRRQETAALLQFWGESGIHDGCRDLVRTARQSFALPDKRYVSVTPDPKLLGQALRFQLLLRFLVFLRKEALLSIEEAETFRAVLQDTFDPQPESVVALRPVESPEVVLEIMARLAREMPVADLDEPFRKGDKRLGAWRIISGVRHLVMAEGSWKRAFGKAARAQADVDATFLQQSDWHKELQKILAYAECIKHTGSNPRYRHDLYNNGTRDTTYVVAFPAALLEDADGGKLPGKSTDGGQSTTPGNLPDPSMDSEQIESKKGDSF